MRTVGSGFARKRWSVSRMRREDLPTAASPVSYLPLSTLYQLLNMQTSCTPVMMNLRT